MSLGAVTEERIALAFAEAALITAQAAASVIGVDAKTLRVLTDDLAIRAVRIHKVRRYAEADIRRYLTEGPATECPSISPRKAATSSTISFRRAKGFTALQGSRRGALQKV